MEALNEWLDERYPQRDAPLAWMLGGYNLEAAIVRQSPGGVAHALNDLEIEGALPCLDWAEVLRRATLAVICDNQGRALPTGAPPTPEALVVHAMVANQAELPVHLLWGLLNQSFPEALAGPLATTLAQHPAPLIEPATMEKAMGRLLLVDPQALEDLVAAWQPRWSGERVGVNEVFRTAIRRGHESLARRLWTWGKWVDDEEWHRGNRGRALEANMTALYLRLVDDHMDWANPHHQSDLWLDVIVYRQPEAIAAVLPRLPQSPAFVKELQGPAAAEVWEALDQALSRPQADLEPWRTFLEAHGTSEQLPRLAHWRIAQRRQETLAERPATPSRPRRRS